MAIDFIRDIIENPLQGTQDLPTAGKWNFCVYDVCRNRISIDVKTLNHKHTIKLIIENDATIHYISPDRNRFPSFSSFLHSVGLRFRDYEGYGNHKMMHN